METITMEQLEKAKPKTCGYITQQGDFYPTIAFNAVHGVGGDHLWMQQDLIKADEFAQLCLVNSDISYLTEEYNALRASIGEVDSNGVIDRYIADKWAVIKFARLHEERYGSAIDKTVYPKKEGLITAQALLTLSWLYGINYNPNPNFSEIQLESTMRLARKIGNIAL